MKCTSLKIDNKLKGIRKLKIKPICFLKTLQKYYVMIH